MLLCPTLTWTILQASIACCGSAFIGLFRFTWSDLDQVEHKLKAYNRFFVTQMVAVAELEAEKVSGAQFSLNRCKSGRYVRGLERDVRSFGPAAPSRDTQAFLQAIAGEVGSFRRGGPKVTEAL